MVRFSDHAPEGSNNLPARARQVTVEARGKRIFAYQQLAGIGDPVYLKSLNLKRISGAISSGDNRPKSRLFLSMDGLGIEVDGQEPNLS